MKNNTKINLRIKFQIFYKFISISKKIIVDFQMLLKGKIYLKKFRKKYI